MGGKEADIFLELDHLSSYIVEIRFQKQRSFYFDLKAFLYLNVVIPHGKKFFNFFVNNLNL